MALQAAFTRFGFTFPEAYHRVSHYEGDKVTTTFTITTYASTEARQSGAEPIGSMTYQCTYAPDVLTACYNYVKTTGAFTDAADV